MMQVRTDVVVEKVGIVEGMAVVFNVKQNTKGRKRDIGVLHPSQVKSTE